MLLQDFLRNGGTVEELQSRYAIKTATHGEYPNLVLFKYHQIDSPFAEKIVQECRGVILDRDRNWQVVSRSFDKFFNYGEGHAAQIDWSTARVQEKIDGSLCTLYHYDGRWQVATTGMPDAGGEVNGMGFTFAELFWKAWDRLHLPFPADVDQCYMFELTSPYNRVVVQHRDVCLTLLAVRNRASGEWISTDGATQYPIVESYPLQSIEEITATFDKMNPLQQEGYVIVDGNYNRIKVKHPGYVAIHHMRDGFGPRRVLEVIRSGESSELLTYFPEWAGDFRRVETAYNALHDRLVDAYESIKHIETQKDFALLAVKHPCSGALFAYRAGKVKSIREFLANMNVRNLMDTLNLKDEVLAQVA